jgi:hypothetical protein
MFSVSKALVKDHWYTWPTLKISHAMWGVTCSLQLLDICVIFVTALKKHTQTLWVPVKTTSHGCLSTGNPSYKCNKTENGLLHYAAHRPCKVLYFKNATHFCGTNINVISIISIKKVWLFCTNFHESHKCSAALFADLLCQISPKLHNQCRNYKIHLCTT